MQEMQETRVQQGTQEDMDGFPGGQHGNPLQYSCQGDPMDKGAWRDTVHGLPKSRTWQSDWACTHNTVRQVLGLKPLIDEESEVQTSCITWLSSHASKWWSLNSDPGDVAHSTQTSTALIPLQGAPIYVGFHRKKKILLKIVINIVAVQVLSCVHSLWPHELQHTRLPCSSLSPGVCSNSHPLSQ